MPSDCQCSGACTTEIKTVTKVLNNKEASKRLEKLEREVKVLKSSNSTLKSQLSRAKTSKKTLVKKLKDRLDSI